MAIIERFMNCSPEEKALIAFAVLLDGYDAADFLMCDRENGIFLAKMAKDLASIPVETRVPLLGTILREIKEELAAK